MNLASSSLTKYPEPSDRILVNDEACGQAIATEAGTDYNPRAHANFCRVRNGKLMGGVIYSSYTRESIALHMAGWDPHWANRDMLYVAFDYPFNQLGVKRIFGLVPESNLKALEIDLKLGFKIVNRVEGVFPDNVAAMILCMERGECRFLGIKPRGVISNKSVN